MTLPYRVGIINVVNIDMKVVILFSYKTMDDLSAEARWKNVVPTEDSFLGQFSSSLLVF